MNRQGLFVSDFHMFTRRSVAAGLGNALDLAASESDIVVFGGDLIDFKWSTWPDTEQTIANGVSWVSNFLARHPQRQVIYLVGNHDCHPRFLDRLRALADQHDTFELFEFWLRLDDTVFLHGDVIHGQPQHAALPGPLLDHWRCDQRHLRHLSQLACLFL